MATVAVLLADGFEEIEAITILDVLRRASIDVEAVGVEGPRPRGSHGIAVEADATLDERAGATWDLVVLPGGMPGASTLRDDARVQALVKAQAAAGRQLAAICAAPIALGRAGVLEGLPATCYPGFQDQLAGARVVDDAVVETERVVTSRGPGTALAFALTLVRRLRSPEVAAKLEQGMLVAA